jgi:hypothetical protein
VEQREKNMRTENIEAATEQFKRKIPSFVLFYFLRCCNDSTTVMTGEREREREE